MPIEIGGIRVYSAQEIAETFGVTLVTIRSYIHRGKLKGRKIGGKWFFSEESLQEFFKGIEPKVEREKKEEQEAEPEGATRK